MSRKHIRAVHREFLSYTDAMEAKRGRPATGQSPVVSVRVPAPLLEAVKKKLKTRNETTTDLVLRAFTQYAKDRPTDQ